MIKQSLELTKMAEDLGFSAVVVNEQHCHTEGLEAGGAIPLQTCLALATSRIKIGIIGYVLPVWDPIRLATEVAWMDQLTQGRIYVGLALGYQSRYLGTLGQMYGLKGDIYDPEDARRLREVFEEVYQIMKLSWRDEAFRYDGKYYKVPLPRKITWRPHELTKTCGAQGELDDASSVQAISPVPKPYQKPHPPLFQAHTFSDSTIRWCAQEGIIPITQMSIPRQVRGIAEMYQEESAKAGRTLRLGESFGVARYIIFGKNRNEAIAHGKACQFNQWEYIFGPSGFFEAFRFPGEEGPVPRTMDRLMDAKAWIVGTVDDVRRGLDELVRNVNPEWVVAVGDQGFTSLDESKRQLELLGTKIIPEFGD
jgi:alkanesulfonate monooxygenase SsuD/methylene tetrahydromethanopterin reductase-like flavin-dependent oxidoreductase (luciferase family)